MGVFARGKKLWITFRDIDGKWRNAATGYDVGQEELAQAVLDEILARVRKATPAAASGPLLALTVRAYSEEWLEDRRRLDLDWKMTAAGSSTTSCP